MYTTNEPVYNLLPANKSDLNDLHDVYYTRWKDFCRLNLNLNAARDAPPIEQQYLVHNQEQTEIIRSYRQCSVQEALAATRMLFAEFWGGEDTRLVTLGVSRLKVLTNLLETMLQVGASKTGGPWRSLEQPKLLCPVPGYHEHLRLCEKLGITALPVPILKDGPDMDVVEKLVHQDAGIRGILCVPKFSPPTGIIYGAETIERLAAMQTAVDDFRIFWDNAYLLSFAQEHVTIPDLLGLCERYGQPDRVFKLASTEKISSPDYGIAAVASSKTNLDWWCANSRICSRLPEPVQLMKHLYLFKNKNNLLQLMEGHSRALQKIFAVVDNVFHGFFDQWKFARWSRPKGGYSISLDLPVGCARRTVELCTHAGIVLPPAGSTFFQGHDPYDSNLCIAPCTLSLKEAELAAQGIALSALLSGIEIKCNYRIRIHG